MPGKENTSEEDIGICIWWDNGASMPPCVVVFLLLVGVVLHTMYVINKKVFTSSF